MPQNPDYASYLASRTAQTSQADGFNAPGDSGSSLFDRVPPHDPAAEMAVLGGMLMSKEAVGEVSELIVSSDFYDPKNQMIFDTVIKLYSSSQPADVITTVNELTRNGEIGKVGGSEYVHQLVESVPTAANASFYANIIHEQAILREVIQAGTRITQLGYSADGSQAEDIVNLAQAQAYELGNGNVRQDYRSFISVADETLKQLDDIQQGNIPLGVKTGFRDIDDLTQGLQPGQMIVVAGRPAMGKSTLGVDFARSAALRQGLTTIIFSLEMNSIELAQRILSAETNIPLSALRKPDEITPERWGVLNSTFDKL
ncbi:MAG: replicative DNA helicase, partial [Scardovia wiggsiae]|nr:replicative DNA helicase [Scardovia wiggsiae]